VIGRNTQGVKVMTPQPGAKVSAVARAIADEKEASLTENGAMPAVNGGDANDDSGDADDADEVDDTEA